MSNPYPHDPERPERGRAGDPVSDVRDTRDVRETRDERPAERSGHGGVIAGLVIAALLLIVMLIFVAQNSAKTTISFFDWEGSVSLAVALLAAFLAGVLLVAIPGYLRVLQLKHRVRKLR